MSLAQWIEKIDRWLTPAPHVLDRLIEAEKLPLNNPERKLAQKLYDQEYGQCKALEAAFRKKWRRFDHQRPLYIGRYYYGSRYDRYDFHILSLQETANLANWLCDKAKVARLHGVAVSNKSWNYYSLNRGMIYMEPRADLAVAVHEIAHHIHLQSTSARWFDEYHGEEFLRIEMMLFHLLLVEGKLPTNNRENNNEPTRIH